MNQDLNTIRTHTHTIYIYKWKQKKKVDTVHYYYYYLPWHCIFGYALITDICTLLLSLSITVIQSKNVNVVNATAVYDDIHNINADNLQFHWDDDNSQSRNSIYLYIRRTNRDKGNNNNENIGVNIDSHISVNDDRGIIHDDDDWEIDWNGWNWKTEPIEFDQSISLPINNDTICI